MQSDLFVINWKDIKSGIVFGLLILVIEIIGYVLSVGSVFKIEWHNLVDATVLPVLGAILSIVKSFLTTTKGNFIGLVNVK